MPIWQILNSKLPLLFQKDPNHIPEQMWEYLHQVHKFITWLINLKNVQRVVLEFIPLMMQWSIDSFVRHYTTAKSVHAYSAWQFQFAIHYIQGCSNIKGRWRHVFTSFWQIGQPYSNQGADYAHLLGASPHLFWTLLQPCKYVPIFYEKIQHKIWQIFLSKNSIRLQGCAKTLSKCQWIKMAWNCPA